MKEILIIDIILAFELASYYTGKQILLKTGGFVSIDFPDFSVNEFQHQSYHKGESSMYHRLLKNFSITLYLF